MVKSKARSYTINTFSLLIVFFVIFGLISNGGINNYYSSILISILISIIMAVSLNLTTGLLGQLCLGHAGFMSVGAYTAGIITKALPNMPFGLSLFIALLAGGLLSAVCGFLIGMPALRLKGDYLAIITLGFGEIIRVIIQNLEITGGASGLTGIPRMSRKLAETPKDSSAMQFAIVFWITVVVVTSIFTLGRSRHGRAIISIRENEVAAEATGIPITRYKLLAFTLAAFFAGIAGGLHAHQIGMLTPKYFDFNKSIEYLVIVVLGGMGSITGSIISATVLITLPEVLREFAAWRMVIYSLALVLMMIFRPTGLMGTNEFSLTAFVDSMADYFRKHFKRKDSKPTLPFQPHYDVWENQPVLNTVDLGICFGGLVAAKDINISLKDNEIVGLIGPNGAGKTTIFNLLTGVYTPTEGDIILLGNSIINKPTYEITNNGIARTFQNIRLFKSMTALENIKVAFHTRMRYSPMDGIIRNSQFSSEERGIDIRARELLRVFDMEEYADDNAASLPYGLQRKLEICRALATNPKVLLLDEPAAGMNATETAELMETIKRIRTRFSVAILLIEHDMKLVMGICERIYVLNYGKIIAEGTPNEIAVNEDVITAYLGMPEQDKKEANNECNA
ncbi:MAG: ABC transporter permease subunit [Christensenellales bacterium]|jgi:branched-chain amino acid transport system permease protein